MFGVGVLLVAVWSAPLVLCDEPENLANLGQVLVNTSSLVGGEVFFYCEVTGIQTVGESLQFIKVDPNTGTPEAVSSDSEVLDTTKYAVSARYNLTIKNVQYSDEGEYRCQLGAQTPEVAYLVVSDPPTEASIYWGNGLDYTQKDVKANLTCEATTSRPPASFRWYRGATEITGISINPKVTVDGNGYGRGISMLELTPDAKEEGVLYTCAADVPGEYSAVVKKINVSFSGAGHVMASVCLVLTSLLASLKS